MAARTGFENKSSKPEALEKQRHGEQLTESAAGHTVHGLLDRGKNWIFILHKYEQLLHLVVMFSFFPSVNNNFALCGKYCLSALNRVLNY